MPQAFKLNELRNNLDLTQGEMASMMGLGLRAFQELESNERKIRKRHMRLAELVSLEIAVKTAAPELASPRMRQLALELAKLILKDNFQTKANAILHTLFRE